MSFGSEFQSLTILLVNLLCPNVVLLTGRRNLWQCPLVELSSEILIIGGTAVGSLIPVIILNTSIKSPRRRLCFSVGSLSVLSLAG